MKTSSDLSPNPSFSDGHAKKGKLTGQKRPFKPKHVWAIRTRLQLANKIRDLALFNLAIDSKLRGCELVRLVEAGPDLEVDGVVRWRRVDLQAVIKDRFGIDYGERWVSQILHALGFSPFECTSPAPSAGWRCDRGVQKNFPVTLAAHLSGWDPRRPLEIWWQDEARIGQKNGLARLWARKGTRPRQPADQRHKNAYLFGAICPAKAKGAAIVMPKANTHAMQLHLDEIACNVARGAQGVVLMDRAGWHTTAKLKVPKNLTIILLPSRSPELNPVENIWQYLRQNWLSNRVFENYDAILQACCDAWNRLVAQPETIKSIGIRQWPNIV